MASVISCSHGSLLGYSAQGENLTMEDIVMKCHDKPLGYVHLVKEQLTV